MIVFCAVCSKNVSATNKGAYYYCSKCESKIELEIEAYVATGVTDKSAVLDDENGVTQSKRTEVSLTSIEVYELILFGWLKHLKTMGLSSEFRKCVRDLWSKYRARILTKKENGQIEMVLTPNFAKRDLEIMMGKQYKRKKNYTSSRYKKSKKFKKSTKMNGILEKTLNGDVKSDGGGDDDDDDDEDDGDNNFKEEEEDDDDDEDDDLMQPTKYIKTSTAFIMGVLKMTKHKLLSFLYLGLIMTREKFLLAELNTAIVNGTLPFQDICSFLPSDEAKDINYSYMLHTDFRYTHAKMSTMTRRLIQFLELDDVKETEGLDFYEILERFAKIYHFPKKIVDCIMKLIKLIPPVVEQFPGQRSTRSREIFCFAFVIFILKLLFFLDDYHEYVLDAFAEKFDREYFSFVKWTKFLRFRSAFFDQYKQFKECNERDEKHCEHFFWQTNDDPDFDLETFFNNQDTDSNDEIVLEEPEFKSFEDLSLKYIFDAEKYKQDFEDVSLSKPYKRKIKYIRNVEDLRGSIKPITESIPKYMPFDHVKTTKNVRILVENYMERNKGKKLKPAFNSNFHINRTKLKMGNDKRKRNEKRKKSGADEDEVVTEAERNFNAIFDSQNYWFSSLDFHRQKILCRIEEFNEKKLPTFPKSFAFLFTEFAKFAQCTPCSIFFYFQKIELRFVDFEVKLDDNSCKLNYLRRLLHKMW